MKKIALLLLVMFSLSTTFAQVTVTNRNGKEITVNKEASTTEKGIVKLAGHLGGTADAPTVPALSNKLEGNGIINYVPKFTAAKTLGNSLLFDDGTNMGIGTILPSAKLEINSGISGTSGLKFTNLTSANTPIINSKFLSLDASGNVVYATYLTSVPLITANGINSATTEVRDYNVWANRGNGFYITDVGGPIANPIPNNPAWFTLSQVAKESSFYGQTALSDLGFWFRGGNQATIGSNNWRKTISLNANSRFDIGWGASDNTISINNVDNGPMLFATNDSEKMRILPNGNIGIGTIAPANKIEITHGTAGNSGLRFTNLNSASTATTSSNKVLSLNSSGDVILTNVPGTQNIVDFSTATPTTSGVVFTPNTPADESVVYQSAVDNSMWTYNGTAYVTYAAPASTAWYTAGTTNDAGSNKTSNIFRTGNVGIGTNNPSTKLHMQGIQTTMGANANAPMLRMSRPTWSGYKWGSAAQFNLGTYDDGANPGNSKSRLDLVLANVDETLLTTPTMTWLANGNVGIGTSAPSGGLTIFGLPTSGLTATISGKTGITKEILFGRGGATKGSAAIAAVDEGNYGGGLAFFTKAANGSDNFPTSAIQAMNIDWLGNVGIGATDPVTTLHINNSLASTNTVNADAKVLRLSRPTVATTTKWDNIAQFNLGSYSSTSTNARSRLDLALTDGASTTTSNVMTWQGNGNVGIGTTAPGSKLEVNGSATNTVAINNGVTTLIAFSSSNLAYTSLSANNTFTLNGIKDGGTYTLAVQGTTSGTAIFASLPASFTFKYINNGPTIAGKETLYTFIVMGTSVYVYMAAGFQ